MTFDAFSVSATSEFSLAKSQTEKAAAEVSRLEQLLESAYAALTYCKAVEAVRLENLNDVCGD